MALLLAQTIELTSLRTAQHGTMSEDDVFNLVLLKAVPGQHVPVFSLATGCSRAAAKAQRFKDDHPELKLINHLVNVKTFFKQLKKSRMITYFMCFRMSAA